MDTKSIYKPEPIKIMTNNLRRDASQPTLDHRIFWFSFLLVIVSSFALILFPHSAGVWLEMVRLKIIHSLDWLYLPLAASAFVFALWLALGRYGHIKLGAKTEKPEYSNLHWIAMMFTAGIGSGLIIWGFAEPIHYLKTPPFNIEPFSDKSREWAHMYPLFHWSILPWAIYVVPAVPIAYQLYVKGVKSMRVSDACDAALPRKARTTYKNIIDIIIVLGIVGGTVTTLGLAVPLISALISAIFGIEDNNLTKLIILLAWIVLVGLSVSKGLKKGIKILADFNMLLAVLVIIFIFIVGPTLFILEISVNSFGLMLDNYMGMVFWTDPIAKTSFPEDWTIFYWAWWISYSAFVGLFIARISRGRTIRQLVLGVIGWGSLGTWVFLSVTGAYSLSLDVGGQLPMTQILAEDGMSALVAEIIATLPYPKTLLILFTVLGVVFAATCIDSAAYVVSSVCFKNLNNDQEPQLLNRLVWLVSLAAMTAGLVVVDGLSTVLAITIISSVPLIPIIILICLSFYRQLAEHKT